MKKNTIIIIGLLGLAALAPFAIAEVPLSGGRDQRSPTEIVDAAPAGDWAPIVAADLLVMQLQPSADQGARRVVIQLMPPPFSAGWTGNIRKLAKAHWWDGLSVYRVQDNYVAQWGDVSEKKPVPQGLAVMTEANYLTPDWPGKDWIFAQADGRADSYAGATGFHAGWPLGQGKGGLWPLHCYGMVGVARELSPDTGSGAELYAVIGHAPRQLDRNIALIGRVIEGIEHLSALPRGTGKSGFYDKAAQRVPIVSIRLGGDMADAPKFEYLSSDSASFRSYADARANRRDPFFIQPAGGVDICNLPVPVRRKTN